MSLDAAFLILLLLVILYITFIEIFTVVFRLTGMSHTRAVFQVISLLTSCGFTTAESEIIVSSRKRRKIAITIMIFGNIFNVAVVSLLVNAIISFAKNEKSFNEMQSALYLIAFFIFITLVKRVPFIRVKFDKLVKRIATKIMFNKNSNPFLILDNFHGFVIVEVKVFEVPEKLKKRTLLESRISKDYGIKILTIKREDRTIADVSKDEVIKENDRLMVYGPLNHIVEVFKQQPSYYSKRQ